MRIRTLLHIVLVAVILAFVGKIVSTWRRPLPTLSGKVAPEPVPVVGEPHPSLTPEAKDAFVTTIAQNDLFSPERGETPAPPVVDDGPKKIDPPSHLKLVGVVLTRSRAEAFLSDTSQGNKVVRVKQGDSIGQYQLLQVAAAEVKLSLGGGEVALLQLHLLDSATSQQAPHLMPNAVQPRVGFGRPGPPPGRAISPVGADPNQPEPPAQAPEEAQALRDNIQRMQQRLRRIRRRAAREEATAQGQGSTGGGGEEQEQEEESNDDE